MNGRGSHDVDAQHVRAHALCPSFAPASSLRVASRTSSPPTDANACANARASPTPRSRGAARESRKRGRRGRERRGAARATWGAPTRRPKRRGGGNWRTASTDRVALRPRRRAETERPTAQWPPPTIRTQRPPTAHICAHTPSDQWPADRDPASQPATRPPARPHATPPSGQDGEDPTTETWNVQAPRSGATPSARGSPR